MIHIALKELFLFILIMMSCSFFNKKRFYFIFVVVVVFVLKLTTTNKIRETQNKHIPLTSILYDLSELSTLKHKTIEIVTNN